MTGTEFLHIGLAYFTRFSSPFIDTIFRVETVGIEQVPNEGRGMLISNHSAEFLWMPECYFLR